MSAGIFRAGSCRLSVRTGLLKNRGMSENKRFRSGVLFGDEVKALLDYAKASHFALPAINCIGTNSVNATLAAARELNSPTMIQF